jgi:heat shock protein HtpX
MRARISPIVLAVVGLALTSAYAGSWLALSGPRDAPWWSGLFLTLLAVALVSIAGAVTIDPHALELRRALAGAALAWLAIIALTLVAESNSGVAVSEMLATAIPMLLLGLTLTDLAMTTPEMTGDRTDAAGRLGAVVVFAVAIVAADGLAVVLVALVGATVDALASGDLAGRLPWAAAGAIVIIPAVTFAIAAIGTRRANGGTFYAQAAANRRNSLLLLVTLVGVVAVTAEIIAISLTFDAIPALWAAGAAGLVGVGAAAGANRFGADIILDTAGAHRADPSSESVLFDVVREVAIAADIPVPAVYVIEDGSQNAFATGRDPEHASIAVTRGLLDGMDREELQGVIGHELGHVRNLDTRYALYVAVMVGLVALATDGFLRLVIEGWKHGMFYWRGSGKGAAGALATGLLVGLFLLIVATLLRVFAPLFSALVQASTSRQREFLADATSVEFTRNPRGLERALVSIAGDRDTLEAANRGTQHLWFRNPVKPGSDRRSGLLATHPSLEARIDRLRLLEGLPPIDPVAAGITAEET